MSIDVEGVGFYETPSKIYYFDESERSWVVSDNGQVVAKEVVFIPNAAEYREEGIDPDLARRCLAAIQAALPPPEPGMEWIALHTDAPVAFDGFSTRTVAIVGKSKRGEAVRLIEVQKRDYEWQTARYSSGAFVMYTAGGMTLEGNVRLGDWIIDE